MWKKPIRKEGARESDFAYAVKLIWIKTKYDDSYDELTTKHIIENIEKYSKLTAIPIEYYNNKGELLQTNYSTVKDNWIPKYNWHNCYEAYEEEMLLKNKVKAISIFDKKILQDTITDFKTIDEIDREISEFFRKQREGVGDFVYKIAKLEETKNSIFHRIMERLSLTNQSEEVVEKQDYIPINDDPAHETRENREFWNDILWTLVDKR